ncbi:tape measure protein, partial [Leucobacter sp. M11]|uniref:tape measure protein n=1 Tax=Leucobacter sp. M11 TaxID=2993565 RepID=UPI002D809CD0
MKTGVEYNTLQQTTRAALTTLLGSAEAANAQMDKLDAFAKTSPFAKGSFIKAQQQMLAFGVETQKVIPYLDAVQNAVAAAGGSNADIEGIVATMAKIQSSSKITAQDLNEFGNRGVNAAELIGSRMGKTGAQIREEITAGSLGATEALDALTAGMAEKFEGASANVKNTFAGAMDRVKAAWRDFSSELARPLVDPNGGGALVDLLNWAADAMRAFEDLPAPVKTTISAMTGLAGVGSLAGGTFMLALPKFLEFQDAL